MNQFEIIATFDTPQTARQAAKLINAWLAWIMEGDEDDTEKLESMFDDFGLSFDDYLLDQDAETDWEEIPEAYSEGSKVIIDLDSSGGGSVGIDTIADTVKELLEAMGAYDVSVAGDE